MKRTIRKLIRFSLDRKGFILSLAIMLMFFGLYTYTHIRYDVFPEFSPPQVSIQTEAPGLSPEQVELLITQPIEQAINGTVGLSTLHSTSIQGLSVIVATFDPASDIFRDRQLIAERLSGLANKLPFNVTPIMTPLTSSTGRILTIGLTSNTTSLMSLRTLADWTIKPSLLSIPGVANVTIFSQDVKQYQIQIDPARMIQYHLALSDIIHTVQKATGVVGAGFIENNNQRITLQTEGQANTVEKLAKTVLLHRNGVSVTLGDVAKIVIGPAPPIGAATVTDFPAVHLLIDEQYGANTLTVTQAVEEKLQALLPMFKKQGIQLYPGIFRTADFIVTAVHNLKISLALGAVLVILILFVFLFNFRAAIISLAAIPLSLIAAVIVLHYFGLGLNTMTLGGLAIAIGLLVDDAVITVENIYRRLRENHHSKKPRSVSSVILNATLEVRNAVVYATLVLAFVFIPVLSLPGLAGRLFSPLAIAYILATIASLIVALTVTPAFSLFLLSNHALPEKEPPLAHWLKSRYVTALEKVEQQSKNLIVIIVIITFTALSLIPFLGGEFLPHLNEGSIIVHMNASPGTSLAQSLSLGKEVVHTLSQLPYVTSIAQEAGRAELGTDIHGPQNNEFDVKLKPLSGGASQSAINEIRKKLSTIPGAQFSIETPLAERIEETLSGYTAAVVVNIFGNDLSQLDHIANDVSHLLNQISGVADLQIQSLINSPQLYIQLRHEDLARFGFAPLDVMDAIRTAYQNERINQVYEGNQIFDVSVLLSKKDRHDITQISQLPLRNLTGTYILLRELADIYQAEGRFSVLHESGRRVQAVTCNVAGRSIQKFVMDVKQTLSKLNLPPGYYIEYAGTATARAASVHALMITSVIDGILIIFLLSLVIKESRNLFLMLANLPFSFVGGVAAILLTGGEFSIGALVGLVTLFGITLRNSIMLLSHYEHLVYVEKESWNFETMIRGSVERLSPILMTVLVTALGLLPLAFASGSPGREIEGPMAIVILGGLISSAALNLLILPTLVLRFGRFKS